VTKELSYLHDLPGDKMAKYKRYDYSQRVLIPVSLEQQLVPGTLEFAIRTLVETRMDMSVFDDMEQKHAG